MIAYLQESFDIKIRKVENITPTKAKFEAILQTANEVNRNKRYYPKDVIQRAIDDAKDRIDDRIFGGELDHPFPTSDEEYTMARHMTLSLKEMSHIITNLRWEGNNLVALVETTSTPSGAILAGLIYDKVRVRFSIRAFSNNVEQKPDGITYVGGPMTIIAIDAVSSPSHKSAVLKEVKNLDVVIKEAKQFSCEKGMCALLEFARKMNGTETPTLLNESNMSHDKVLSIFDKLRSKPFYF